MSNNNQVEADAYKDNSNRNLAMVFFVLLSLGYASTYATDFLNKKIKRMRVETLQSERAEEVGTLPEKLSILVGRGSGKSLNIETAKLNMAFSPTAYMLSLPPIRETPKYKAPPTPRPTPPPPVMDVHGLVLNQLELTSVTNNGAFINGRYYSVGDVVLEEVPKGEVEKIRAVLTSVSARSALITANGLNIPLSMNTNS